MQFKGGLKVPDNSTDQQDETNVSNNYNLAHSIDPIGHPRLESRTLDYAIYFVDVMHICTLGFQRY